MSDILDFFEPIERIKRKEREGWKQLKKQGKIKGVIETIGSHSFGATLIGWLLAERENLDKEKIIKLLIVHDLVMAYMPDITPKNSEYERKKDIEDSTVNNVIKNIPKELRNEFESLMLEYQNQKTKESQLAREADKLDTLLQAFFYSKENSKKEILQEFLGSYGRFLKSKAGKRILEELVNMSK